MKMEDVKQKWAEWKKYAPDCRNKTVCVIDTFLNWMYKVGKSFMAVVIALLSLVLIASIFYAVFHGPSHDIAPEFKVSQTQSAKSDGEPDVSKEEISKKFSKPIRKICNITKQDPEQLVHIIGWVNKEHRKTFVNGMLHYLEDAQDELKPEEFDAVEVANEYIRLFEKRERNFTRQKEEASEHCKIAWGIAIFALYSILMAMILPLLIQIQENTKKN